MNRIHFKTCHKHRCADNNKNESTMLKIGLIFKVSFFHKKIFDTFFKKKKDLGKKFLEVAILKQKKN